MHADQVDVPASGGRRRIGLGVAIGAVVGLVLGVVVTAGIAVWAIYTAADSGRTVVAEPVLTVTVDSDSQVHAESGAGIGVPVLVGLAVGAVAGGGIGYARRGRDERG